MKRRIRGVLVTVNMTRMTHEDGGVNLVSSETTTKYDLMYDLRGRMHVLQGEREIISHPWHLSPNLSAVLRSRQNHSGAAAAASLTAPPLGLAVEADALSEAPIVSVTDMASLVMMDSLQSTRTEMLAGRAFSLSLSESHRALCALAWPRNPDVFFSVKKCLIDTI